MEVSENHLPLVRAVADMGVAVMAHLGLKPQSVGLLGGYRAQGRNAADARAIVDLAVRMQRAGAATVLLEAVPPEVAEAVVEATELPVIGCGAGPHCHGHVVVTHDAVGLTPKPPRFVPKLADLASPAVGAYAEYVRLVSEGMYPASEHEYQMEAEQRLNFLAAPRSPEGQSV